MGAIPIVQRSSVSSQLFQGHPVLIMDDYSKMNNDTLLSFLNALDKKPVRRDHLWAEYWWEKMQGIKQALQQ